ncbi:MAG: hypothetical protein AVDCRST_MAG77-4394 [uncultured Chloroflexi bacterium]|uniref:DUF1802 family protein n=1 Tax=uncultured Chloroflexota bacterium TaxID=166587 RepID=A0A6J4JU69_9CHLR|nr:MAG: hypothetical protein AVDCRST_MAG77-4394 [uncultured Chloroflexota bacterium]
MTTLQSSPLPVPREQEPTAVEPVALKEWDLVCRLLLAGEQVLLLRKGGIHEPHRGGFAVEHESFFLYPNTEHQQADLVQERFRDRLVWPAPPAPAHETGIVQVPGFCRVVTVREVRQVRDPAVLAPLAAHTCWTQALFEQRLRYKPERPLLAVVVRTYRLPQPVALPYHRAYAGCRSWVPLRDEVPASLVDQAEPVLDGVSFARNADQVLGMIDLIDRQDSR